MTVIYLSSWILFGISVKHAYGLTLHNIQLLVPIIFSLKEILHKIIYIINVMDVVLILLYSGVWVYDKHRMVQKWNYVQSYGWCILMSLPIHWIIGRFHYFPFHNYSIIPTSSLTSWPLYNLILSRISNPSPYFTWVNGPLTPCTMSPFYPTQHPSVPIINMS